MSELATFGGGCFWCMEPPFKNIQGVLSIFPGYMGGSLKNPTYEQVCQGNTGHVEVVQIEFDPPCDYQQLLEIFWRSIDPTDSGGQFADRGSQYEPVIFYHNQEQFRQAEGSKDEISKSGKFEEGVKVSFRQAEIFYKAESYHCNYAEKSPAHYNAYKVGSGRAAFLKKYWE